MHLCTKTLDSLLKGVCRAVKMSFQLGCYLNIILVISHFFPHYDLHHYKVMLILNVFFPPSGRTMAANMGSMRILIKGGKVVNDDFTQEADVYIENGIIQQVDYIYIHKLYKRILTMHSHKIPYTVKHYAISLSVLKYFMHTQKLVSHTFTVQCICSC